MENETVMNETVLDDQRDDESATETESPGQEESEVEEETVEDTEDTDTDEDDGEEEDTDTEEESDDADDDESDDLADFGYEEFEYDDEGNIIIPEASTKTDEHTASSEEGETESDDDLRKQLEEAQQELRDIKGHTKKMLKKYGIEEDNIVDGLIKMGAEADGVTPEEYAAHHKAEIDAQDRLMKDDLAALHSAFPETRKYKTMLEIPNFTRFGQLRDMGLSAKEAFSASNPDLVRSSAAKAAKRANNGKSHLRPVVGKSSSKGETVISSRQMREFREMFPNMSDAEIRKLYNDTN